MGNGPIAASLHTKGNKIYTIHWTQNHTTCMIGRYHCDQSSVLLEGTRMYGSCWLCCKVLQSKNIQGDSGGKVDILGWNRTCHGEGRKSYEHMSNSAWLRTDSRLGLPI